jgi:hypothetical protein
MRAVNGPDGWDMSYRQDPSQNVLRSRLDRSRLLLSSNVMVDAGAWRLAREIASTCDEPDGWAAEGLRGLWNPEGGPHGTLRMWSAGYATHSDAARILGLPSGPEDADIQTMRSWEVEINRSSDGTMYLCWSRHGGEVGDAIMSDPRIGFVDGQLARNGRILRAVEGRVAFAQPVDPLTRDERRDGMEAKLRARAEEKESWRRSVARIVASTNRRSNGIPPQPEVLGMAMDAMRTLRRMGRCPAPHVEVSHNGEIAFEWRGAGHYARLEFRPRWSDARSSPTKYAGPSTTNG